VNDYGRLRAKLVRQICRFFFEGVAPTSHILCHMLKSREFLQQNISNKTFGKYNPNQYGIVETLCSNAFCLAEANNKLKIRYVLQNIPLNLFFN
jgi:hypothetical protein